MALNPTVITVLEPKRFEPEHFDDQDLLDGLQNIRWVIVGKTPDGTSMTFVVYTRQPDLRDSTRQGTLITRQGCEIHLQELTVVGDVESGKQLTLM